MNELSQRLAEVVCEIAAGNPDLFASGWDCLGRNLLSLVASSLLEVGHLANAPTHRTGPAVRTELEELGLQQKARWDMPPANFPVGSAGPAAAHTVQHAAAAAAAADAVATPGKHSMDPSSSLDRFAHSM